MMTNSSPARRSRGSTASSLSFTARRLRAEQAHPAQLRKLALMGVKHEVALVAEGRLENRALALAQRDGVGVVARFGTRARPVAVEEHPVQVGTVNQVELG